MTNIYVERALPTDPDVQWLRVAGSAELKQLTGSSRESSFLLRELEGYAKSCGYRAAWLDTRKANSHAVAFYIAQGYRIRANYGHYVGLNDALCPEKELGAERRRER